MREEAAHPARGEWVLLGAVLVVLMRSPVLFLRQQLDVGGPIASTWQDDALVRTAFIAAELAALVLAARVLPAAAWRRHLLLAAFLAFCVASTAWSVEPSTTQLRAMQFAGTAVVGVLVGERFALRAQLRLVTLAVGAAAVASALAVVLLPDVGRATNGVDGLWSGVFVNRNLLGAAMGLGLLAGALLLPSTAGRARAGLAALLALELGLLWGSGTRTTLVALAFAAGVAAIAAVARRWRAQLPRWAGAAATSAVTGAVIGVVHLQWDRVLDLLGRDSTLTRRVVMWAVDRYFIDQRPGRGWGFEAIWTHPPAIDIAVANLGAYPYQAHNGYYELLLGVGGAGFALFLAYTLLVLWRAFAAAWTGDGWTSLWPLAVCGYVLIGNFSEGFLIANEIQWALFVAAGCASAQRLGGRASTSA